MWYGAEMSDKTRWYCSCRNCDATCEVFCSKTATPDEARKEFALKNWHIRPSACPEHQSEEEKERIKQLTSDTKSATVSTASKTLVQNILF